MHCRCVFIRKHRCKTTQWWYCPQPLSFGPCCLDSPCVSNYRLEKCTYMRTPTHPQTQGIQAMGGAVHDPGDQPVLHSNSPYVSDNPHTQECTYMRTPTGARHPEEKHAIGSRGVMGLICIQTAHTSLTSLTQECTYMRTHTTLHARHPNDGRCYPQP